jgi:hypothetical protein
MVVEVYDDGFGRHVAGRLSTVATETSSSKDDSTPDLWCCSRLSLTAANCANDLHAGSRTPARILSLFVTHRAELIGDVLTKFRARLRR